MLKDKAGNKLYRSVKIRVIFPDNILPDQNILQHAGPRKGFSADNIDEMLLDVADRLEQLYPFWEFKAQEMTPEHRTARWLITFAGFRAVPETTPKEESPTPGPEMVEVSRQQMLETTPAVPPSQE